LEILFYHAHHFDEVHKFVKDFPSATIICTTRDPRAGFVSTIENWKKYDNSNKSLINFDHDSYLFFYFHLNRIIEDEGRLVYSDKKHIIVKLEDLPNVDYMQSLSNLLFIDYNESMLLPTFGGKIWYGDRISGSKIYKVNWSKDRTYNGWKEKLPWREKFLINHAMYSKLKRNNYENFPFKTLSIIPLLFLSIIPFKYERRYISIKYIKSLYKFNRLRAIYYIAITPLIFMKVRILILKYIIIQFLNDKNIKNSYFLP
jgi:hypothetical protein